MTSMHDLLDDLATTAPAADGGTAAARFWRAARRRRTRRRLVGAAAVAGVLVVAAVVGLGIRPSAQQSLPADQPLQPGQGIPSTIYDVHPWLPTIGSDPVPPVAYVYALPYGRPIALSVDGTYRYLPEPPGQAKGGEMSSSAVSPDGLHLAVAWSPSAGEAPTPAHAVVYVYDLATGERRGPWLGQGLASRITGLSWRWDDSGLAWEEFRSDEPDGSSGTARVVVLDWVAGVRKDVDGYIGPVAWSPDSRSLVAQNAEVGDGFQRLEILSMDGAAPVPLPESVGVGPLAWSPDGRSLAVIHPCLSQSNFTADLSSCSIHDPETADPDQDGVDVVTLDSGAVTSRPLSAFGPDATVLGWREGNPVVGGGSAGSLQQSDAWREPYLVGEVTATGRLIEITGSPDPRIVHAASAAQGLLAAAPVVELPPPSQPRFGPLWWVYAWERKPAAVVLFWLVAAPILFLVLRTVVRRWRTARRLSPRPRP